MSSRWRRDKLTRFAQLDSADRRLLLRAAACLAVARVMIAVMPFRRLAERLSAGRESAHGEPDPELLRRIGSAVSIAASQVPWRSDCLPQGIAARMLLRRHGYGSTMHFGVGRGGEGEFTGHAWLTCGDTVVTGGAERDRYTEMLPL